MHRSKALAGALLLAVVPWSVVARAERTPPRPPALADGPSARVIVQFKDGASTLRAHALAAGSDAFSQQLALSGRAQALAARRGLALRSGAGISERSQVVHGPEGMSSQALADLLAADPEVEFAVPDRRMRRLATPNDTLFPLGGPGSRGPRSGQWYLRTPNPEHPASIDAQAAWDRTRGDANVIVAVLDTGVRRDHPDLRDKLIGGYDFVTNEDGKPAISNDQQGVNGGRDDDPSDPGDWLTQSEINADPVFWDGCEASPSSWHGTQVAGIVGAATDNGAGMAGTGWNVRVMPVRVLGKCFGYTSDIQAAMRWAAGLTVPGVPNNPNPAQVINLSLGGTATCDEPNTTQDWKSAVDEVTRKGVVIVAAAGNSIGRAASAPANCPGVIGVAGVRHVGSKVGYSDVGPQLAIAAPGGNCVNETGACLYPILSTTDAGVTTPQRPTYTDAFDAGFGTSFAAPQVASVVALMVSARLAAGLPALAPTQVKSALQSSARAFPTGLTDALTGEPVPPCRAPNDIDQFECICTTSTCGAAKLVPNPASNASV